MPARKRTRDEVEESVNVPIPPQNSMLVKLRNTWEFANLMQYIFIFGKAVKIDEDFDIEDLEHECLKPGPSEKLKEIGLCLLKHVSSHRGLTPEIFDEYTRRQYMAKAPQRNPFGEEEEPNKFDDFDVFTKLRVLVQLSVWTFNNAERMREKMADTKDSEQIQWRMEEIGYDAQERLYFVLDDNRLYRRTDPPILPPVALKPKANSKKGRAAARASKRRKVVEEDDDEEGDVSRVSDQTEVTTGDEENTFAGRKWECIAVTLPEYRDFLSTLKTRNPDEKYLHRHITDEVLPIISKAEEAQLRKQQKMAREMQTLEKLATAKRSSRLAGKQEREQAEREAAEAERKRKADLEAALRDQERQKNMADQRESRMMTREQRLKEREYKRILHEEELKKLAEDEGKVDAGEARLSERHLKAEMAKRKKELEELQQEDDWTFDCSVCGVYGENLDDGTHSVACEKCNVWQHSACLGISQSAAESPDFHFVCRDCKARAEQAARPKPSTIKLKMPGSSSSPPGPPRRPVEVSVPPKRKENDGIRHMPPMKKFKPMEHKPTAQANGMNEIARAATSAQATQNNDLIDLHPHHSSLHLHASRHPLANGHAQQSRSRPPLSPQSQMPSERQNLSPQRPVQWQQPPQGLSQLNGHDSTQVYSQHPSLPPPTNQSSPSGQPHQIAQQRSPQLQTPRQNIASFQGTQNPFLTSFDRQYTSPQFPSPLNGPTLSPPSQARPESSHQHLQQHHQTSHNASPPLMNGNINGTTAPLLPSPAPYPPVKHDTPHTSPVLHPSQRLSRSPVAQPPPPLQKPPSHPEAGISPVKQSPPRPGSGYASLQHTPVIAPPLVGATMIESNGVAEARNEDETRREKEGSPVKGGASRRLGLGLGFGAGSSGE